MKTSWAFQIRAEGDAVDIDIYDVVGDPYGDAPTAKQVLDTLASAKGAKQINVRINSVGGEVFAGLSMYSLLADHKAKKTVYIDGLAASIASIIAMAGDEIVMSESAMMMVHHPWSIAIGDAADMRATADFLDKVSGQLVGIYAARTGQKTDDVATAMAAETWMTAKEAKALGYATKITPSKKAAAHAGLAFNLADFTRVPAAARAIAESSKPVEKPLNDTVPEDGRAVAATPPTPITAALSGAGQRKNRIMNKDELKAQHPELYAVVLSEGRTEGEKSGASRERDRVKAHLVMGESSGDMKTAVASIQEGAEMSLEIQAKYMSAAMNRRDVGARQADSNAAGAVLDNAVIPPANAGKDMGDQVADLLAAERGKK